MTSAHRWTTAGEEFVRLLTTEYDNDGALHWPTVIAATACLCGETALMAHESRVPEFGSVESTKVADFMHNGEATNRTILGYCAAIAKEAFNVEVEHLPPYRDVVQSLGLQLLPGSFPALSVAAHVMPHETPMNAGPRLRKTVYEIASREGLGMNDASFALATAAMKMIGTAQDLGVRDLTILVQQCCVAGSRFAPTLALVANPAFRRNESQPTQAITAPVLKTVEEAPRIPAAAAVAAVLSSGDGAGLGKRR